MDSARTKKNSDPSNATKQLGGFELIKKIGQGAMGAVFEARQESLDRVVALKVLPPTIAKDKSFIKRFRREAQASAKLNHPNIIQGIDVGQDEATGLWYFAMQFVDGPSLKQVLQKEQRIPEARALKMAREIASGLECAEKHHIVHRDIKPDNIMLNSTGEALLADLGLAKNIKDDASMTQSGTAIGTPHYMSPEQARGDLKAIDIRTDIYGLGATLFHLVTGQTPFDGPTGAVIMAKHLNDPVPKAHTVNSNVSDACSQLIIDMMQKKLANRIKTPGEVIKRIDRILAGHTTGPVAAVKGARRTGARQPIRGRSTGPLDPVNNRSARTTQDAKESHSTHLILAGVVVLTVTGLGMMLLKGSPESKKTTRHNTRKRPKKRESRNSQNHKKPATPTKEPIKENVAATTEGNSRAAFINLRSKLDSLPSTDRVAHVEAIQAFLDTNSETKENQKAQDLLAQWQKPNPQPAPEIATPKPLPAAKSTNELKPATQASAASDPVKDSSATDSKAAIVKEQKKVKQLLSGYLDQLERAVEKHDFARVLKIGEQAKTDPKLNAITEEVKSFSTVTTTLGSDQSKRDKAWEAALKKLIGKKISLRTTKGPRKGKVLSANNESLSLVQHFIINGKQKTGATFKVALESLTIEQRNILWVEPKPGTPDEWMAQVVRKVAHKEPTGAVEALTHVPAHPLVSHYQRRIKTLKMNIQDAAAHTFWNENMAAYLQKKKISSAEAKAGLKKLASFFALHGTSSFASTLTQKSNELKDRLEAADEAIVRNKQLAALFHGKVEAVNYQERTIKVIYDFSDPNQMKDFNTTLSYHKGNVLNCGNVANMPLSIGRFLPKETTIHVSYAFQSDRNRFLGIWLGAPEPKNVRFVVAGSVLYQGKDNKIVLGRKFFAVKEITNRTDLIFPKSGTVKIQGKEGRLSASMDGKQFLDCEWSTKDVKPGFGFGGGYGTSIQIKHLEIEGRLDENWVREQLNFKKPAATPRKKGEGRKRGQGIEKKVRVKQEKNDSHYSARYR